MKFEFVGTEKLLGVERSFRPKRSRTVQEKREDDTIDVCARARSDPRSMSDKALLAGALGIPKYVFGSDFQAPRVEDTKVVRKAVTDALWTTSGAQKAVEVPYAVLPRGHRVDLEPAVQVETLPHLSRLLRKPPQELAPLFDEIWIIKQEVGINQCPRGLVGNARKSCASGVGLGPAPSELPIRRGMSRTF